jgi:hypothetical protein
MMSPYQKFYRDFYLRTAGYIPSKPLNQNMYPGDFFQIRNGEIILLGNIFRNGIIDPEDVSFGSGIRLNLASWNFSEGISKPYSGRGNGRNAIEGEFEFSRQIIGFNNKGSFFFKGNNPESFRIQNWNEIQQQLIIKMTQTVFSFRSLYIVTESATASDWTLAISGSANGELEIASDNENYGLADLFGHHSSKTIQSKEIEYYHRETNKKPAFFKAKKLVVQDEPLSEFISDLILESQTHNEWASTFFNYGFHIEQYDNATVSETAKSCLLDRLQANELNPTTALLYFKWEDANLDDIEKLFLINGN